MTPITIWIKPVCVQCNAVKRRLVEKFTGRTGFTPVQIGDELGKLVKAGVVAIEDLTVEKNEKNLSYFKGIGYSSAPLTEYKNSIVPGYIPDELDRMIEAWKSDHAAYAAGV